MAKKKNRQRNQKLIVAGVMTVLAVVVGIVLANGLGGSAGSEQAASPETTKTPAAEETPTSEAAAPAAPAEPTLPAGPTLVADNGRTLWASPTAGGPIGLGYLPPDCQMVLHLRPAELLAETQAAKALDAIGPTGKRLLTSVEKIVGSPLRGLAGLTIGLRAGANKTLEPTMVVEPTAPLVEADGEFTPRVGRLGRRVEHAGAKYRIAGAWCYFAPPEEAGRRFVVATRPAMHEVLDAGGAAPPLRREMEQLLDASDADRHVSLLVAPSFLFTGGKTLFAGDTAALRPVLFDETPDELYAALVSVHWSADRFYWEIKGAPASDITEQRLVIRLADRITQWPSAVQLAVLDANPAPHGRQVVAKLPLMMNVAAKYARSGTERRHAVVNGYLPAAAGHNLLLAAELLLAQQSAGGARGPAVATAATPPREPRTAVEKLRQNVTVAFARDTLEMAVQLLADEVGVPIQLVGRDLQLDGITKNQSFGLDARNQPAEQVLLEILTQANPDKTATGPADPKQKLVYVIREEADGEKIYVTTRAAAAKRNEKLPAVFGR